MTEAGGRWEDFRTVHTLCVLGSTAWVLGLFSGDDPSPVGGYGVDDVTPWVGGNLKCLRARPVGQLWLRVTHSLVTPHYPWCSDRLCSDVFLSGSGVITLHDGARRQFSASTPVPPLHLSRFIISSPITFHPKRREKLCRWQHDLPNKSTNYGGNRTLEWKTQMRGRC